MKSKRYQLNQARAKLVKPVGEGGIGVRLSIGDDVVVVGCEGVVEGDQVFVIGVGDGEAHGEGGGTKKVYLV
jgi:hypothetical protein